MTPKKLTPERLCNLKDIRTGLTSWEVAELLSHIAAVEQERDEWKAMISTNIMHVQMGELRAQNENLNRLNETLAMRVAEVERERGACTCTSEPGMCHRCVINMCNAQAIQLDALRAERDRFHKALAEETKSR